MCGRSPTDWSCGWCRAPACRAYGASAGAPLARNGGSIIGGADVRNEVTGAALAEYSTVSG